MRTKNIIRIFGASILLWFTSCDKFLEVEPREYVSDQATIVDAASARTAVRGIYSQLRSGGYYGFEFQLLGLYSGDNVAHVGSQIVRRQLSTHTVRSDFAQLETVWNAIYNTINRANHVIDKVPGLPVSADFTQEERDGLVGEAYFIRALAYFDLARTWGGVQLILEPTASASSLPDVKRSSLQDTYLQILADLNTAENLLPETTNRIRATKKTAWALKARYHLYQKEWDEAIEYATKIIDDAANYELVYPYSAFYANSTSGTKETVFELYYDINAVTDNNNQAYQWRPGSEGGVSWTRPTHPSLPTPNNRWDVVSLLTDPNIGGNRPSLIDGEIIQGEQQWYGTLYHRGNRTDPAFLIRTAELYLIRAEALAERNQADDAADALADLNDIRDRADVPLLDIAAVATKADLL